MRMMVIVLSLLIGALLALPVEARNAIVLYDASGGSPAVAEEVQDFRNAGVSIQHTIARRMPCGTARKKAPDRALVLCLQDLPKGIFGRTSQCRGCQTIVRIDPEHQTTGTVCHELMHAITHIGDREDLPERDASCVWGRLPHLGPFDLAYLQQYLH